MDDAICTHICDTHVLIGNVYLQAMERLTLHNTGRTDDTEDLVVPLNELFIQMNKEKPEASKVYIKHDFLFLD